MVGEKMNEFDLKMLKKSFEIAASAKAHGNHPFGALLVDDKGNIVLEAENSVVTDEDCTHHAEINLVSQASKQFSLDFLENCTLYSSTEPCPMCAGAIYWSNIRRVVFGLAQVRLYEISKGDAFILPCKEVFSKGSKEIEVIGPLLEEEAALVHVGFWK
jgi:tRNA(Arg) A34 adenosine deaminase TadA